MGILPGLGHTCGYGGHRSGGGTCCYSGIAKQFSLLEIQPYIHRDLGTQVKYPLVKLVGGGGRGRRIILHLISLIQNIDFPSQEGRLYRQVLKMCRLRKQREGQ